MTDEEDLDKLLDDVRASMKQWSYKSYGSWLIAKALNNISKKLDIANK